MTAALALAMSSAAHATITYTFDSDNQGWTYGDVAQVTAASFGPAPWAGGRLSLGDMASQTGVFAPAAVLGDQSGAYGGSISWKVADAFNDGVPYAALILYGATMNASIDLGPPSTDVDNLTKYTVTLNESNFRAFTGGFNSSAAPLTEAQFRSILGNLQGIGFNTEYKTGGDDSRFDDAVFNGFGSSTGAVPEPSVWAFMIFGFSLVGARARRAGAATFLVA